MRGFGKIIGITVLLAGCVSENEDAMLDAGAGACVPGRALECACPGGASGTQACLEDQTFGDCICGDEPGGECEPGDTEQDACEGGDRARRCGDDGRWADWSRCEGGCDAGAEQMKPCGANERGEQRRACVDGAWEAWSVCDDPDSCADGEEEDQPCGEDGTRSRTCEEGAWSSWTLCEEDTPECPDDGAEQREPCGRNERGMRSRTCEDGAWSAWSECADDDRCRDDDVMREPCGDDGERSRTCNRGRWGNWTACIEDERPVDGCPVAVARDANIEAEPLETIRLVPGQASLPGGPDDPVAWSWVVVNRPDGSTAAIREPNTERRDDAGTPQAQFFLDLAGRYVFELRVEGESGKIAPSDACPQAPARVTVDVVSEQAVHIQLVWDTPSDEDQADSDGTDLDLHLRHFDARSWNVSPGDCYWQNAEPDWGRPGAANNPSLDIDDTNGAGPENISLDQPEDTGAGDGYAIGVEYYRSNDFLGAREWGHSIATLRVFLNGELAADYERRLERSGNFWDVARIEWRRGDGEVHPVNQVLPNRP